MSRIICHNVYTKKNVELANATNFSIIDHACIFSVPHNSTLIPISLRYHYGTGRELLIDVDLFTDRVHLPNFGTQLVFQIAPYVVNVSRPLTPKTDDKTPAHMARDPFHILSLFGGEMLKKPLTPQEIETLTTWYHEYHTRLKEAIMTMKKQHGFALVFDCHSMLSVGLKNTPDQGKKRADFVIGTRDGASADPRIIDAFMERLEICCRPQRWRALRDAPYKGGHITQHYGNPDDNVHVIQVEVSKKTYMHEGYLEPRDNEFTPKPSLKIVQDILADAYNHATSVAHDLLKK